MIGKTIGERYQIVSKIGEGGMGLVYKATDTNLKRSVAIKMLHPLLANDMLKTRFQIEAVITASLNHPAIVTLYDFFEEENNHFIVMELLNGKTGKELLQGKEPISFPTLVGILSHVIEGLAYAHRHEIIHRDIKPNNIIITDTGQVKLMDFGIAKAMDSPNMTQVGYTVGSALYMSPEQIKNEGVDRRSDIYSLGITMFEMATGKPPFYDANSSEFNILSGHLNSEFPLPSLLNPHIPEALERVILKATRKRPEERFQSMEELGQALASSADATRIQPLFSNGATLNRVRTLTREEYIPTSSSSPPPARPGFLRKERMLLGIVVLASLALFAVVIGRWYFEGSGAPPRQIAVTVPPPVVARPDTSQSVPLETPIETQKNPDTPKQEPVVPAPALKVGSLKAFHLSKSRGMAELKESDTLTTDDRYYVVFSPEEELHVYIAQIDTAGIITPVFPNVEFSSRHNPLEQRVECRLPEKDYFFLGGDPGKEYLYAIASHGPNARLDQIYRELGWADDQRKKQLAEEFVQIFLRQEPGNVRMLSFLHH